jgi:cytochrome b561
MRKVFAWLATLLMVLVVAQFYFAAYGAFSSAPNDESFAPHRAMGYAIFLLTVVMTIVGALTRIPGRLIGMSGLVAGLGALQVVIAVLARAFGETGDITTTAGQLVFGLHAVNGLAIMAVVGSVLRQARALSGPAVAHGRPGDAAEASGSVAGPAPAAS